MAPTRKPNSRTKNVAVPTEDAFGHQQPQNIEMERAVIGALLIEQDAYSLVSELLRPESFYDHRHQVLFDAVRSLSAQQRPVDILTIQDYLESQGTLEDAGGPAYLLQLSANVTSSAHIEYHARIIAQKFLARELITFASQVSRDAFDSTIDVDDLMQEAEGKLFAISQQNYATLYNRKKVDAYKLFYAKYYSK